jgi:hypothetical protein
MTNALGMRILNPVPGVMLGGTPSANNHIVDASNEGVAWVFDTRSTNAITHLGFRYGARTGTPPTYIIGLEGVSTSTGNPDGTYVGGGSPASATFTPPADTTDDGVWKWIALSNSYTPTLSQRLAITIRYSSGTIDGSNNSSFTSRWSGMSPELGSFPYSLTNTAGTWTKGTSAPIYGVRTASERYGPIIPNLYATRTAATIGHRQAMKVNLPAGFGDTYKVAGFRASASIATTTGKAPLAKIWSASAALASKTMDVDQMGSPTSGAYRTVEVFFDTSVTLNFGTDYYFGFEVAETTNSGILIYGTRYLDTTDKSYIEGGSYCVGSSYDGSTWTDYDDATVRPWMELILEDWTEPSGGGGLLLPVVRPI